MLTSPEKTLRSGRLAAGEFALENVLLGLNIKAIGYTRCPPPDPETIKQLNAVASSSPFCRIHKAKRHDTY